MDFLELSYGTHELQTVHYVKTDSSLPWILFIHGGAWRDPSNTWKDGLHCLSTLHSRYGVSIASVDYRLAPESQKDDFPKDIASAIVQLRKMGMVDYVIIGHSAGAFIALQLPQFTKFLPSNVFGLDGIYDLRSLVLEYPSYNEFVEFAFGSDSENWPDILTSSDRYSGNLALIQSAEDELLSMAQTTRASLFFPNAPVHIISGLHEDVYKGPEIITIMSSFLDSVGKATEPTTTLRIVDISS
ncbi:hypothetical protein CANCADRAFT_26848 [Tortispora caseinolytica NRRL Y-17796]|uniref:Alpha/beta hydrolase fold-3 domain-containing protein n=1 Tax=Tortispora caseinolytica NRRL Y-17796 TaxID=767744 RepID=A0A1E4TGT7_9ASCO|nr:hypothetical protein CANCADRAFT_26848 [Tortispora caseinolytica NRRL Y-17796]